MIDFSDIQAAAARLRGKAHVTPIQTCAHIDELTGARVFFKCENLQRVGAFKFRGATNAIASLSDAEAERGVATQSSGNHGQAVALAAKLRAIPAYVVMPNNVPAIKRAAVAGYGAEIIECEPTAAARDRTLDRVASETGAYVVHPYNDWRVMAGQGTAALELCEAVPDLDLVLTPVSGGGLLAGTATSVKHLVPTAQVIGAEPAGADDAWRSFRAGRRITDIKPDTIADGLRAIIGEKPFSVIRARVDDIVRVDDAATIRAMRLVWERMKLVIEPSAAVPVAALLERTIETEGRRIGVILSGGNVDLDRLPWQN
ncbi:MAG TPA: pyridoxal-phosphate dependent enzyme [Gammaproteobacteria bacterium]|nr:pyridoxal-phosphate dependent enzyme [Gammaproteobacteria bacterium]